MRDTIRSGTLHLDDEEFVRAFEACEIAGELFHHADHVRLAWIYIHEYGERPATELMLTGIRLFAVHVGKAEKFHYTQTCAWVRLISAAHNRTPDLNLSLEFLAVHPELLDASALASYYSKIVLESTSARSGWVEPDISPLPSVSN